MEYHIVLKRLEYRLNYEDLTYMYDKWRWRLVSTLLLPTGVEYIFERPKD